MRWGAGGGGNGPKRGFQEQLQRRLEQRLGGQCLAGTNRLKGRWGRTAATGGADRHAKGGSRGRGGGKGNIRRREGRGVWDPTVCVPAMAQQDVPYCLFRFFPRWSIWSWGGGVRGGGNPSSPYGVRPFYYFPGGTFPPSRPNPAPAPGSARQRSRPRSICARLPLAVTTRAGVRHCVPPRNPRDATTAVDGDSIQHRRTPMPRLPTERSPNDPPPPPTPHPQGGLPKRRHCSNGGGGGRCVKEKQSGPVMRSQKAMWNAVAMIPLPFARDLDNKASEERGVWAERHTRHTQYLRIIVA